MNEKDWKDMTGAERGTYLRSQHTLTMANAEKQKKVLEEERKKWMETQKKKAEEAAQKLKEFWTKKPTEEVKHADKDAGNHAVQGGPELKRPQGASAKDESHVGGVKDAERGPARPADKSAHVQPKAPARKP